MVSASSPVRDPGIEVLLVRAHTWLCALRLEDVVETSRPLPMEPVPGAPAFVRGVTVLRGQSVPVVHLTSLFSPTLGLRDAHGGSPGSRFVAVRAGERIVALDVDEVLGVELISRADLTAAPPLLGSALREH